MRYVNNDIIHNKTILPISDLHCMWASLIENTINDNSQGNVIDYITISGDIFSMDSFDTALEKLVHFIDVTSPGTKLVFIAGNHDSYEWDYNDVLRRYGLSDRAFYLYNECKVIDGITFYGCPYSLPYGSYNYMKDDKGIWNVLDNTMSSVDVGKIDVALFHSPPFKFGDKSHDGRYLGSESVLDAIRKYKPRYSFWGHIHEGDHSLFEIEDRCFGKNVALLDRFNNQHSSQLTSLFTI